MSDRREQVLKPFIEEKEYMNERVVSGIEANRKGRVTLRFVDAEGKAVNNVHAELTQRTHDFRYGANLFMLDELETPEKNEMYKERFAECFNMATLPFYWRDLEPERGKQRYAIDSPKIYRRPAPDLCVQYCKEHGIEPKMHCLCYDQWAPYWLPTDLAGIRREYIRRMEELSARYGADIPTWEVTNETIFQPGPNFTAAYFDPDYCQWCFKEADRHFPNNRLLINDAHCNIWNVFNSTRSQYYLQIENLLLKGARIDTIGMQFHMFYRAEVEAQETGIFYSPRHMYDVMDCYARFGRPLQITELTIPAYTESAEDEDIQAEILKNIYSMWFSHPAMEAIVYWNLVDGYAAFAPQGDMTAGENYYRGGLLRFDFTPKKAFYTIRDLFKKTWRTNDTVHTGEEGNTASFKGFYGEYDAKITVNGATIPMNIHLAKQDQHDITVRLPL